MTTVIGMLGRESRFKGKQRLDWVVAWAGEQRTLDVFHPPQKLHLPADSAERAVKRCGGGVRVDGTRLG
jgi:hypothetical protein